MALLEDPMTAATRDLGMREDAEWHRAELEVRYHGLVGRREHAGHG